MIYNEEYARKIRLGKLVPRYLWVRNRPLANLGKPKPAPPPMPKLKPVANCIACGDEMNWVLYHNSKGKPICFDCLIWTMKYKKRNKEQTNLFE